MIASQTSGVGWRVGAVVLVAGALGVNPAHLDGQTQAVGLAYQLTHSVNVDPTLAPDGTRMVFIALIAGREQLFAMNLDGSEFS